MGLNIVHEQALVVINHCNFLAVCRDVYEADGCCLLNQGDWESVVDEDLEDAAVAAPYEETFALGRTAEGLDVLDVGLEDPLALEHPCECEELDLLLEAEHQVMREHKQVAAVNLLADLLVGLVLHVVWVFGGHAVDDDLLVQLHCQSILVDRYLLNVVATSDLYSGFRDQVLDDDVGHQLSVRVSFLVEAVHLVHVDLMQLDLPVVAAREDRLVLGVHRSRPNPVFHLAHSAKQYTLSVPECYLLVASRHDEVVTLGEEADGAGVKTELFGGADRLCSLSSLH